MEKIFDFVKKHPYIIINVLGFLITLACFFSETLAGFGFILIFIIVLFSAFGICLLILFAINIAAFLAVAYDKSVLGILLSLPFGSLGAFIAMKTCNISHKSDKAIKIIFNIHIWIVVWIAVSFLLYLLGYYDFSIF